MRNQQDVLVIGAGLAGAVAARLLAEKGRKVLVIEKNPHVGGNCFDELSSAGVTIHRYGPHIFHTNNKPVWDFCNRFTPFRFFQHRVLSYVDGQLLPFPINRDTLCQLYGIDLSIRDVASFLADEVSRSEFANPPQNFRDAVVSQVGETLYEKFFHHYTVKQWEEDPKNLSAEIAGRIPVRQNRDDRYFTDRYQGLPEQGYTAMITRILDHPGIDLQLSTDFEADKKQLTAPGRFHNLIYTGRLDGYFDEELGRLDYRSVHFEFRTLPIRQYQPVAVVNYPNDYDFTRITEFKHMTGEQSASTAICLEYPSAQGVPAYVVLNQENLARRQAYLARVAELAKQGILFVGRLAEYRYYNMDQVIASVMAKIEPLS